MSEKPKCPICGKNLIEIQFGKRWFLACDNSKCRCKGVASYVVWEHIDRTRKALEIAVGAIDEILYLDSGKFCKEPAEMWKIAKSAKDKITALEQKDEE